MLDLHSSTKNLCYDTHSMCVLLLHIPAFYSLSMTNPLTHTSNLLMTLNCLLLPEGQKYVLIAVINTPPK